LPKSPKLPKLQIEKQKRFNRKGRQRAQRESAARRGKGYFYDYIDFANTVDFKEKQKVPHSYSRAEENARFA